MLSWIGGIGVLLASVALIAGLRARRERRRSASEMRDYVRRNFRIGENPWDS